MLLTHEHNDHVSGVDAVMLDLHHRLLGELDHTLGIAVAEGVYERLENNFGDSTHFFGRDHEAVQWFDPRDGDTLEHAGARVEAVAMEHSVPDNGYRVHLDGGVVAYSGDTSPGDHLLRLAEGSDVLIVECGGAFTGIHCSWDDLRELRTQLPRLDGDADHPLRRDDGARGHRGDRRHHAGRRLRHVRVRPLTRPSRRLC